MAQRPPVSPSQELANTGIKAYIQKQYETAVTALYRAIELKVAEHHEKHDSLGRVYLYYGKSLLELSRQQAEPLGEAVSRDFDQDFDDEDDSDEEETPGAGGEATDGDKTNGGSGEKKADAAEKAEPAEAANGDKTSVDEENGEPQAPDEPSSSGPSAEVVADKAAEEGESTEDKSDEEPSDLQLAWEVLEMAKLIFEQRAEGGRVQLAEALIALGEVSLESENFQSAVTDIKQGLDIFKEVLRPDHRILAETYYKYGMALATNNQVDEAIENYNVSLNVLNKRLDVLKLNAEEEEDEIEQIEKVIPEIEEKIADMKSYKEEQDLRAKSSSRMPDLGLNREGGGATVAKSGASSASKLATVLGLPPPSNETKPAAGSSIKQVCDISHLVKRKRKLDDDADTSEAGPTKKPPSI